MAFIDSSQRSLKPVLRKRNSKPSTPIAQHIHAKETYDKMKLLLEAIRYNVHQWNICGDVKVTGMLMGRQGGFAASYAHGTVAPEPNNASSVNENGGRPMSQKNTVTNTFLSLIPWRYFFLFPQKTRVD